MADRRRDIWMYSILYHTCRILGVLPVSRNLHLNLALHPCGPEQDCFSPSPNGMVVNLLHIVFCSVSAYVLRHPLPTNKAATALFSLWAVNWASAIVALLVSLFYTKEIAECLSSTCRNVTFSSTHLYRLPFLLFILLLLFPLFPVLHTCPCLVFYKWVLFNYAYAPVAAVEVIISMVTFLTERHRHLHYCPPAENTVAWESYIVSVRLSHRHLHYCPPAENTVAWESYIVSVRLSHRHLHYCPPAENTVAWESYIVSVRLSTWCNNHVRSHSVANQVKTARMFSLTD
ncbi:hypothetical protein J6590_088126 [Homalodisca vitripennis]|nr:hypothetical protein J6590_088126 [Homalodisca vitripennis]